MKRFSVLFVVPMSCLFWVATKQQAIFIISAAFVILCIYGLILALNVSKKLTTKLQFVLPLMTGFIWGGISILHWLITIPTLIPKPEVYDAQGYVCSIPIHDNNQRITFDFCVNKLNGYVLPFLSRNKLRLTIYRASNGLKEQILAGSFWQFKTKLKPIHGRLNPGGFDYEKWLVSENFIGTGYVREQYALDSPKTFQSEYHAIRQNVLTAVSTLSPNTKNRGLILALALGDRSQISDEQWQAVQGSGTSHLLAISGLHIGIAALWSYYFVLTIVRRLKFVISRVPAQRIAEIGSLTGAAMITLLSGLGYPAQRALIMLSVYFVFRWLGRSLSGANTLSLAVIIILFLQPFAILTISFWLSVLAVIIIVLLTSYQGETNGKATALKGWLRLNWYLFISLLPITWLIFDSISMVGFMANVILIPLTSFVTTPLIYLGMLLIPVSVNLASAVYIGVDWVMSFTLVIQTFFSTINETLTVSSLSPIEFGLLFSAIFLLLLPGKIPGKRAVYPIFLLLAFSFYTSSRYFPKSELPELVTAMNQTNRYELDPKTIENEPLKLVVFDIGQGLAVHINKGRKNGLYDTGYGNKDFSMSKTSLLPYFKRNGIDYLDQLIISHGDSDHAGGVNDLLAEIKVHQVYSGEQLPIKTIPSNPALLKTAPIKTLNCHSKSSVNAGPELFSVEAASLSESENQSTKLAMSENQGLYGQAPNGDMPNWKWGGTSFHFLEHAIPGVEGNNASCVLLIIHQGKKLLLTGDIEKSAEGRLIANDKNGLLRGIDVVISPHHGSLTSSTEPFVKFIAAKVAIHSAGYANQWGFPKEEVLRRYAAANATNFVTHKQGAITVTVSSESGVTISTERESRSHFWY